MKSRKIYARGSFSINTAPSSITTMLAAMLSKRLPQKSLPTPMTMETD